MMASGALPAEPVVALDELVGDEARRHPLEMAVETIVEAFAGSRSLDPPTAFLAKEGHRREYVCALVGLYRSMHPYLLHETHNCASVAFVREVPEAAPAAAGAAGEGGEGEAGGPGGVPARVNSSRAASSANMERPKVAGTAARSFGGGAAAADPEQLREAVRRGSVSELLALGASRPEAELLVHVRPERLEALKKLQAGIEGKLQQYMQAHGPLLHLHFMATLPDKQGSGLGRSLLEHLERMADAEGKHLYLEASSTDSRRLYQQHGFKDVDVLKVGGEGGITFYIMARPPGAPKPAGGDVKASGGAATAAAAEAQ